MRAKKHVRQDIIRKRLYICALIIITLNLFITFCVFSFKHHFKRNIHIYDEISKLPALPSRKELIKYEYKNHKGPKVSIILPTFNGMDYLPQSVQSVLDQTMKDFELIIVNDASTDHTKEYLETIRDPRVKIIHHEMNKKLPGALNTGFAASRGEYVTWVSSDNNCTKNFLQVLCEKISEFPEAKFIYADYYVIDDEGKLLRNLPGGAVDHEGIYRAGGGRYSYRRTIYGNGGVAAFLYHRSVIEEIGEYDTQLVGVEDWDYWIRITEKFPEMVYVPEPLAFYRIHDKSMTQTMLDSAMQREMKMLNKALERTSGGKYEDEDSIFSIHGLYPSFKYCVNKEEAFPLINFKFASDTIKTRHHKRLALKYQKIGLENNKMDESPIEYINYAMMYYWNDNFEMALKVLEDAKSKYDERTWGYYASRIAKIKSDIKNNIKQNPRMRLIRRNLNYEPFIKDKFMLNVYDNIKRQMDFRPRKLGVFLNEKYHQQLLMLLTIYDLSPFMIQEIFDPYKIFDEVSIFVKGKGFALLDGKYKIVPYSSDLHAEHLLSSHEVNFIRIYGKNSICSILSNIKVIYSIDDLNDMDEECIKISNQIWTTSQDVSKILLKNDHSPKHKIFEMPDPNAFDFLSRLLIPHIHKNVMKQSTFKEKMKGKHIILVPLVQSSSSAIIEFTKSIHNSGDNFMVIYAWSSELDKEDILYHKIRQVLLQSGSTNFMFVDVDEMKRRLNEQLYESSSLHSIYPWKYLVAQADSVFFAGWSGSESTLVRSILAITCNTRGTIPLAMNDKPINFYIEHKISGVLFEKNFKNFVKTLQILLDENVRSRINENKKRVMNAFRNDRKEEVILYRIEFE